MSKYTLLTGPASEAIDWVMVRLPDAAFDSFRAEAEAAMADICARHGVTPDVLESFRVKHFIADRAPAEPAVFGTMYNYFGDVFLLPDDGGHPLKLHDDSYWYPAAEHLTREAISRVGGGESPARATRLGDPSKGEKTPKTIPLMGDLYRFGTTKEFYTLCGGHWYKPSAESSGLWVKIGNLPMGSNGHMNKVTENVKIDVVNEFYKGE